MSKKPKHTPGNWRLEMGGERPCFLMSGDIHIASMGTNAEGNGPLLRAAPEMLNACLYLINYCERCEIGEDANGESFDAALKDVRAAVAKARGETS